MSEHSRIIGIVEIQCPRCGNNQSYQKILFDNAAEFGECTSCGKMTYNKPLDGIQLNKTPTITCPYCHSTNTKKISNLSKAAGIATFGAFGIPKATKQWHCNNCKSDF